MKTYCGMFYSITIKKHVFEYFNNLLELQDFLGEHKDFELLSLQRVFKV